MKGTTMNEKNTPLTVLGAVAVLGIALGFIISIIPRDFDDNAVLWALVGNGLLQLGIVSLIGWLVVRAVIAQLLYKPRPHAPSDGRG